MAETKAYEDYLTELVQGVQDHALKHYDEGGWDIVVETMEVDDVKNIIRGSRSLNGAIKRMAANVGVTAAVRADIIAAGA